MSHRVKKENHMNSTDYHAFTEQLKTTLQAKQDVLGLVALGSMAAITRRPDAYSDHDFFVITESGLQETYRLDLNWLPDSQNIVISVRETAHGLKVLYDNAHLLEFAIFDEEELHLAKVNDYRVLFDKVSITAQLKKIHADTSDEAQVVDVARGYSIFLSLLLVGAGRAKRGEILSAHVFIKSHALSNLLSVLVNALPHEQEANLDNLDPFRRFEQGYPTLAQKIHTALLEPPLACAMSLLQIADDALNDHFEDYPADAVRVVQAYLAKLA